jgi:hypothetical protein
MRIFKSEVKQMKDDDKPADSANNETNDSPKSS